MFLHNFSTIISYVKCLLIFKHRSFHKLFSFKKVLNSGLLITFLGSHRMSCCDICLTVSSGSGAGIGRGFLLGGQFSLVSVLWWVGSRFLMGLGSG